ncbi:MAG: ABC transporter ATP-binding protein [Planctomycetota bacterium]
MIHAQQLTFGWSDDGPPVLDGLDWSVAAGAFVGLLGPNGCGKSTLLHLLDGLTPPRAGSVRIDGIDLASMRPRERARTVALVSQDPLVPFSFSVREVVEMGRYPWHGRFSPMQPAEHALVDDALDRLDLASLAARPVQSLSGGERQRVAIARTVVQTPRVMLLDEPTSHLDIHHVAQLVQLIHQLTRALGTTVVMVLHDISLAAAVCPAVVLMDRHGKMVAEGPPADVLTPERLEAVYGLPVATHEHAGRTIVSPAWTAPAADTAVADGESALLAHWREAAQP